VTGNEGLICAYILDGQGSGREVGWEEILAWRPEQGVLWVHLDRGSEQAGRWLTEESGIDPVVCESMVSEESSPRLTRFGEALLVNLRGVNMNPGAEPADMVAIRVWLEPARIVTVRGRRILAIQDIRDALSEHSGPEDPGEFLARLIYNLISRMIPVVSELEDELDQIEVELLTSNLSELRMGLGSLRRTTILLRRYLAPQREVLSRVQTERLDWLDAEHKTHLREAAESTVRLVDDLNTVRERAAITQDELNNRLSDQMNRTMYILTLVASILLPLSLLTGLLGINVGGIPGSDKPWAFSAVVALLVLLSVVEVWLLRRLKML